MKMGKCYYWSCEDIARKLLKKIVKHHHESPKMFQIVEDLIYESHNGEPDEVRRALAKQDIELYLTRLRDEVQMEELRHVRV